MHQLGGRPELLPTVTEKTTTVTITAFNGTVTSQQQQSNITGEKDRASNCEKMNILKLVMKR